ncbi:hypothetical protein CFN78_27415 [Amycolatopsis antarctica]|uniref:DUF485 domain-containing protein n=1 Tax=Amycolatopsis antarctica TaxID=1854586 RepID=A0A263CVS4_9PSEU|nr:hypothetical protein [Amycolatopsis antarctica]OZM70059.1 hypothetical protein CFN78_27415 [Amycolatopsis antarctica]
MGADEFHRKADGTREPDPTLGKNVVWRRDPATVEPVPRDPFEQLRDELDSSLREPEQHLKPRRQRVVLADPKQAVTTLRARVELEEQTTWGEVLIQDLARRQLRTGVTVAAVVLLVLGALPVAFFLSPTFAMTSVVGVPLAWLLLGVLPFPLLFVAGLLYNRRAERNERDFVDMIES